MKCLIKWWFRLRGISSQKFSHSFFLIYTFSFRIQSEKDLATNKLELRLETLEANNISSDDFNQLEKNIKQIEYERINKDNLDIKNQIDHHFKDFEWDLSIK